MGRFKKGGAKRTVLQQADVKYLAENTMFNKENIVEWHEVGKQIYLIICFLLLFCLPL